MKTKPFNRIPLTPKLVARFEVKHAKPQQNMRQSIQPIDPHNVNKNWRCSNGEHCTTPLGEVRKVPVGDDSGSNDILCWDCFYYEVITSKRELPLWSQLEVVQ